MDETKRMGINDFNRIASAYRFNAALLLKDYYLTQILYLLRGVGGIFFKGGTALNKIILDNARLSEDIDFTLTCSIQKAKSEILETLASRFPGITQDKEVDGFVRLVVPYKSQLGFEGVIFIDLNRRAGLMLPPETHEPRHFYEGFIPRFSINTLSQCEMIAEKVAAAIGRNKPRDHYDIYKIIQAGLPIDLDLVKQKCQASGDEFDIVKMFSSAKKLKNRWDEDMSVLLNEDVQFSEVMKTLADYFGLKEEKEKRKS